MHKSRLGALVIDCQNGDVAVAGEFWAQVLGYSVDRSADSEAGKWATLEGPPAEVTVLLQRVDHPSRVHLDIESDDIEAEVDRLEKIGAKRVANIKGWVVMEAPTGHRFCVVKPQRPDFPVNAKEWP